MSLKAGDPVRAVVLPPIQAESLRAYAEASGDHNQIHLDEAVAKQAGLPGIIAHGMLTAGFIGERALAFARDSGDKYSLKSLQTRFKAMTLLGDVLSIGGSVREVTPTSLTLDLQAKNQKGELTTSGIAVFQVG
jgi:acyl dehydratase